MTSNAPKKIGWRRRSRRATKRSKNPVGAGDSATAAGSTEGDSSDPSSAKLCKLAPFAAVHRCARVQDSLGSQLLLSSVPHKVLLFIPHLQQGGAELLFDQTDSSADRRLRAMQPIGCPSKPTELGDRDKSAYLVDVHD